MMTEPPGPRPRRPWRALALVGVAVLAGALAALAASVGAAPGPRSALTSSVAAGVVRAYDRAETRATLQLSIPGQNAVETPPESTIDDATFEAEHDQGHHRTAPAPETAVRISVYVPRQRRGAQIFAAYVSSRIAGHPGAILMVFQRSSANARWRQSMSPAYPGYQAAPPVAIGPGGYARRLDSALQARRLRLPAATVAADYAGLMELAVRGDRLVGGDPFAGGALTSRLAAGDRSTVAQLAATGISAGGTAVPAPYPDLALALRGGGALVLFTVSLRQEFGAAPGGALQQGAGRTPWSALVAPGSYRSISTTTLMTVAALVPRAGSTRPVRVVAETGAVIQVAARPVGGVAIA